MLASVCVTDRPTERPLAIITLQVVWTIEPCLAECEPVYVEFKGWRTPTSGARTWKQLPAKARAYLKLITELSNAKLFIASVGPARAQTITL